MRSSILRIWKVGAGKNLTLCKFFPMMTQSRITNNHRCFQCLHSVFSRIPPCSDNLTDCFIQDLHWYLGQEKISPRDLCCSLSHIYLEVYSAGQMKCFQSSVYIPQTAINHSESYVLICTWLQITDLASWGHALWFFSIWFFFYFWCSDHPVISGYRWNYKLLPLPQMVRF